MATETANCPSRYGEDHGESCPDPVTMRAAYARRATRAGFAGLTPTTARRRTSAHGMRAEPGSSRRENGLDIRGIDHTIRP